MTVRAIAVGLLCASGICALAYFSQAVMRQTMFIGNYMPVGVYGILMLFVLFVNPLLRRITARAAFAGKEVAVVLVLALAACCIPASGLMRFFTTTRMLPHHQARVEPGWNSHGIVKLLPPQMLAEVTAETESRVLGGFMHGLPARPGENHIRVSDVPWGAWTTTAWFWLPIVLSVWAACLGLSLVVHRQWSRNEQLAYPLADFADSLLPRRDGTRSSVFGRRLFWIGLAIVFLIHMNNYAHAHFPDHFVQVPHRFDLRPLLDVFPTFSKGWTAQFIMQPFVFYSFVAIAFFLRSDVSLSLGIGTYVFCYMFGAAAAVGYSLDTRGFFDPSPIMFLLFGAYLAMFLSMLYLGRRYYGGVVRRALWLPAAQSDEWGPEAVWGARIAIVAVFVFTVCVMRTGVDWPIALAYVLLLLLLFVVLSRILAETGAFFIMAYWWPCAVLAGIFGPVALGPKIALILMTLSTVLVFDPRETLMPFVVNAWKTLELKGVRIGRTAAWCGITLVLGLCVAGPLTLYLQYDRGHDRTDERPSHHAAPAAFKQALRVKQELVARGQDATAETISGWQRLGHVAFDRPVWTAMAIGAGLVFLLGYCRRHFSWWPLHPVLFLTWQNYPGAIMGASFLLGWLIKTAVTRYGGVSGYQRVKPLMIGVLAGDLLGGVVPFIVSSIEYTITGEPPVSFNTMPR